VRQPVSRRPATGAHPAPFARSTAPQGLVAAAAVLVAMAAGALLADHLKLGLMLTGALVFVALVLIDLPLAIVAWIPLAWIEYSHFTGHAPLYGALLLLVGWLGARTAGWRPPRAGAGGGRLAIAVGLLLVWLTLSMLWASDHGLAWHTVKAWYVCAAALLVIVTTMATPRNVRLVALAFVAGAVVSVLVGVTGHGGLTTTADAVDLATRQRFSGGQGDPNYLAAGLVAAIALGAGVLPSVREPAGKLGIGLAMAAIAAALAATQSRGGLVGGLVALVVAVVLARGRRLHAAAVGVFATAVVAAYLVASPGGLSRVTAFNAGGDGRAELWTLAWRMARDHPVAGVGIAAFQTDAKDYVREPGALQFVRLVVDQPHVTHNLYLQQLAETGVVGLALLLVIVGACLGAAVRAARCFDARGDPALAALARAAVVAIVGFLTASLFISDGTDERLWILLALGPALAIVAGRGAPSDDAAAHGLAARTET
jgi:O-antigen ligase